MRFFEWISHMKQKTNASRVNRVASRRAKRLEQYLEAESHEWTDTIERYRKERDQKERQIDLDLHRERREGSNWLENREIRVSELVLEYDRALILARIDIRKRLALECPDLLADGELSKLEESMLRSVQASRRARRDDYESRANAVGVAVLRPQQEDAAAYGDLEALARRDVRQLALTRSLGRGHKGAGVTEQERTFIQQAILAAQKCVSELGRHSPKVGAVVVKDGKVLAIAHRGQDEQGEHAEFTALDKMLKDDILAGATVYTTLEPCTTRNHPKVSCAQRLIDRKVARVVIGMLDPNEKICGKGVRRLRKANIEVVMFPPDLMAQVEDQNREFERFILDADQKTVCDGRIYRHGWPNDKPTVAGIRNTAGKPLRDAAVRIRFIEEDGTEFTTARADWLVTRTHDRNGDEMTTNHKAGSITLEQDETQPFVLVMHGEDGSHYDSERNEIRPGKWKAHISLLSDDLKPLEGTIGFTVFPDNSLEWDSRNVQLTRKA
jgi:pyrimidine deaminase RibD-like protein